MLRKTKLAFFCNNIIQHPEWLNELLIDYKIRTVGIHKELILIYKLFDFQMICNINHAIKYESNFIRKEYKSETIWLFFRIPDRFYYNIDFLENRLQRVFTDSEIENLEHFYTKKPELSF